ncbi:rho GTPase-activating protein 29-like isoform X2 [Tubulanus polymorphus]|uniref:rho GTPase-activating protein 29-like isoform X2 n=1 Tax=Tubulanus polymorphus TaxID=672921 RepID=UPI003DA34A71
MASLGRKFSSKLTRLKRPNSFSPTPSPLASPSPSSRPIITFEASCEQHHHQQHHDDDRKNGFRNVYTPPLSPACRSKSSSIGSIYSDVMDGQVVDQDDIFSLTHDVRSFSDALSNLKAVFSDETDIGEGMRNSAHEGLGEVLTILKGVLHKYPTLQSTNILEAAGILIASIKNYPYDDEDADPNDFYDGIDQLALAFSSSVSEYLMGDEVTDSTYTQTYTSRTRSYDSLSSAAVNGTITPQDSDKDSLLTGSIATEDVDTTLLRLEAGVDIALSRAKAWSKYTKDLMVYVEKRSQLEVEFAKSLAKLASNMKPNLTEETCLPFQSVFCTALDQDVEYSNTCQATANLIQTQRFIEPLIYRRQEHEKARKTFREAWSKELRRMQEAITALKKGRNNYITRQQEYELAREAAYRTDIDSAKLERKKRLEEEAYHKAVEAETTYKGCVADANNRQVELEKFKTNIIAEIRELILESEEVLRNVVVGYFQLQHTVTAPTPVQYQALGETSQLYECGAKFAEFVRTLPPSLVQEHVEPFVFEPYPPDAKHCDHHHRKPSTQSSELSEAYFHAESPNISSKHKDKNRIPLRVWSHQLGMSSDTESISGSSSKSHDSSPSTSPALRNRLVASSSVDELVSEQKSPDTSAHKLVEGPFKNIQQSRAAQTHTFRKLRTPAKCRECECYLYFNGAECEKCNLAWHKKCLETCSQVCGNRSAAHNLTTFGVHINQQIKDTRAAIPPLIMKCVLEIEKRGMSQKGLYRVSGVKSRVEKLCQLFEIEGEKVDLSEQHPNVISNVLKLYLRQLPEPLLTYQLYPEFIRIAREDTPSNRASTINKLGYLVKLLPRPNYRSLGLLIHHLDKVSMYESENQMTASNLGIVFGPTLLKPREGGASLNSLLDTAHQTRVIELMISNSEKIFGPADDFMPMTVATERNHSPDSGKFRSSSVDPDEKNIQRRQSSCLEPTDDAQSYAVSKESNDSNATEAGHYQSAQKSPRKIEREEEFEYDLPDSFLPDESSSSTCSSAFSPGHSPVTRVCSLPGSSTPRCVDVATARRMFFASTMSGAAPLETETWGSHSGRSSTQNSPISSSASGILPTSVSQPASIGTVSTVSRPTDLLPRNSATINEHSSSDNQTDSREPKFV